MNKTILLLIAVALPVSASADDAKHDMDHHGGASMNHAEMHRDQGAQHDHDADHTVDGHEPGGHSINWCSGGCCLHGVSNTENNNAGQRLPARPMWVYSGIQEDFVRRAPLVVIRAHRSPICACRCQHKDIVGP